MRFLVDLFFPKKCIRCRKFGDYICADCFSSIEFFTQNVCPVCLKASIDGGTHPKCNPRNCLDGSTASVVYKGIVKKLLYQFKYDPYLSDLQSVIGEIFYEGLIQNEAFYAFLKEDVVITSVPLSADKLRKRGYNHAEILAKNLSQKFSIPVNSAILRRIRSTKPQFSLKKEERVKNVKDAFSINILQKDFIKGKTIFLVDDLATTYATLRECSKILKRAGAKKVWGVVFAREQA